MKKELQVKLLELDGEKYAIKIHVGPYVDGFASIYEDDAGNIVFSSEVYTDFPLDDVGESDVNVYEFVENWQEIK